MTKVYYCAQKDTIVPREKGKGHCSNKGGKGRKCCYLIIYRKKNFKVMRHGR